MTSPLAQQLAQMGADPAKDFLRAHRALPAESEMNEYTYVVFIQRNPGVIRAETYAQAYPVAVGNAVMAIEAMVEELKEIKRDEDPKETEALIKYFTLLGEALVSYDPAEQEELYRKVDEAWLRIHGRMQPIHLMESYEDPLGLAVEPEFSLAFLDDRYANVNELGVTAKATLISYMRETYNGYTSLDASIEPMKSSLAGVYTSAVISGRRNSFLPAGQNIPNREAVRIKDGVKIFIDMKTMWQRWATEKELLTKLFGVEEVKHMFADEEAIVNVIAGGFVEGHEVAHNVFIQPGTRMRIGSVRYKDIEENKADQAIVVSMPEILTEEEQQVFLKGFLASLLRDLTLRNDAAKRPYYYGGLVALNMMHEVGLLGEGAGGQWFYDLSPEKMQAFFARAREVFSELAEVYEDMSTEKAETYMGKYYPETTFIFKLLNKVGINLN